MTKQVAKAEVNSFVKGFITEASPLNFPPNASIDEENYELLRDGTRKRRFGIDFETAFEKLDTGFTSSEIVSKGISSFNWRGAAGDVSNQFVVVQFGNRLDIFRADRYSISGEGFINSVIINKFDASQIFSYAAVDGYLIVTGNYSEIAIIVYESSVGFTLSYERLKTRDLWGVEVVGNNYETEPLYRSPTTPPEAQIYNFRNQSWAYPRTKYGSSSQADPLFLYYDEIAAFPSNGDVVWEGVYKSIETGTEKFKAKLMRDIYGAKSSSSKGFFIIDLLERGSSRLERVTNLQNNTGGVPLTYLVSTLPQDKTTGGISVVETFAGRVFYGGFSGEVVGSDARSPNLSNTIFFSQMVRNKTDIAKCYQDGDPTSREESDIVDTDGGFIRISGATNIFKMVNVGDVLVVIADNGVWIVKGGGEYGFTATNYFVEKLSNFGSKSPLAAVSTGDALFYWAYDGIYVVSKDQYGDYKSNNITFASIQKYFDAIDRSVASKVVGIYDEYDKKIKWLIRNTGYVIELVFDVALSAFTKNKFICDGVDILGYVQTPGFAFSSSVEEVVVGGVGVEASGELIIADIEQSGSTTRSIKYLTLAGEMV